MNVLHLIEMYLIRCGVETREPIRNYLTVLTDNFTVIIRHYDNSTVILQKIRLDYLECGDWVKSPASTTFVINMAEPDSFNRIMNVIIA